MAEENKEKTSAIKDDPAGQETPKAGVKAGSGFQVMPMMVMAIAVLVCGAGGFFASKVMFKPASAGAAVEANETQEPEAKAEKKAEKKSGGHGGGEKKASGHGGGGGKGKESSPITATANAWYYELEPVIANLDEPGVTRYVRATLIIEVNNDLDQEEGAALLEENKAVLRNWLTIYMAGCTIDDIRGRKNLMRIQAELKDAFNDQLFKNSKPMISKVLFKEFQIQ